jgi:succinate dehydrogenase/fumarate reductase flavoprotein subunit
MEAILQIGSFSVKKYEHHTVVVGSGAAALSCVERLQHNHVKDIALVQRALRQVHQETQGQINTPITRCLLLDMKVTAYLR